MKEPWDLPSGWTLAPLREIAAINPTNPAKIPADDTPVSFVPMAAVEELSGRMDVSTPRSWSDVRKGFTRFQDGDIVFAKITPSMENGKVALAANLFNGVAAGTTEFHVFRPEAGVTSRYLLHFLLQETFRRRARARMTGTAGQLRVPNQFLEEEALPLPPTSEQQRIVEAIDSYLTRLDDAIANLERVQAKLKAYRASMLKAAVEGRLVPTEASLALAEKRDYEPADVLLARILKERRRRWEEAELAKFKAAGKTPKGDKWKAKYKEPVVPVTSGLPDIPTGWCWVTVDQLAGLGDNTLCDGPFGSNLKTEHYTDHGPRVIRLQNIGDGVFHDEEAHISDSHFARLRRHKVLAGDLLVASLGTELPRACLVPDWLGPAIVKADCLRFAVNPELAESQFVLHALNSPPTRKRTEELVHGVGRPRIGLGLFRTTAIPLPPRAEQVRITALVEQLVSTSSVIQRNADRDKQRCARLRQAILIWAFEGKLADQDPKDEPAEKLLARIRSSRAYVEPVQRTSGRRKRGAA